MNRWVWHEDSIRAEKHEQNNEYNIMSKKKCLHDIRLIMHFGKGSVVYVKRKQERRGVSLQGQISSNIPLALLAKAD